MEARSFQGKRVTVMGLGLFGGGAGLARFLVSQGARVVVTDLKDPTQLSPSLASLKGLPIEFHLGGHREEDFRDVDMVMVNPAVPRDSAFLDMARENGVRLETEMNLFLKLCPAPIVGITGSKGKSTTTALLGEMLSRKVKTWVGGNIGRGYSLLEYINEIAPHHQVVLELSSFQLEDLKEVGMSPHLSIVTNITNNHLDRHKSLESYIEAKKTIIQYQDPEDFAILNHDDPELRRWPGATKARVLWFSIKEAVEEGAFLEKGGISLRTDSKEMRISCLSQVKIPGAHNTQNILAASCAAFLLGVEVQDIEDAIKNFSGLEHRLEFVGQVEGTSYYNDSIATTPESAIAGLRSFEGPLVLIAGGYDKGSPFDAFAEECARRTKAVILIGKTARKIGELIASKSTGNGPEVFFASSLSEAVNLARASSRKGDTVLLSPACASYDMFINFEDRGRQFKALVQAMGGGGV